MNDQRRPPDREAGRRVPGWDIRAQLVALVLVVALPLALVAAVNFRDLLGGARDDAQARAAGLARLVASRVDDYVRESRAVLTVAAAAVRPVAGPDALAANDAMLAAMARELPPYMNSIGVWSPEGANLGHSFPYAPGPRTTVVADRQYFRDALATRDFALGEPAVSRLTGEWTLGIAHPIVRDDGRILGVVTIATQLQRLLEVLAVEGLPERSVVTVLDTTGRVIARSHDAERWVGRDLADSPTVRAALASRLGTGELVGADGVRRLAAYGRTREAPWIVTVGLPIDTAFAALRTLALRNGVLGVAALLGALALALQLATTIVRPLRRLTADAAALGAGDLARRTTVRAPGTVGALAAGFDQMAEALETRTLALIATERRYRLLFEQNPAPMWVFDDETLRFLAVNDAAVARYGWSREEFLRLTIADIRPPEEVPLLHAVRARPRLTRHRFTEPFRHRRKDGSDLLVAVVSDAIVWDGRAARLVLATDVTERVTAERALRAGEARYRAILDDVPLLVGYLDAEERLRVVNRRLEAWLGRPAAAMLGQTVREVVGEAAYGTLRPHLDAALRRGERTSVPFEGPGAGGAVAATGTTTGTTTGTATYVPHRDDDGEVVGVVVLADLRG